MRRMKICKFITAYRLKKVIKPVSDLPVYRLPVTLILQRDIERDSKTDFFISKFSTSWNIVEFCILHNWKNKNNISFKVLSVCIGTLRGVFKFYLESFIPKKVLTYQALYPIFLRKNKYF